MASIPSGICFRCRRIMVCDNVGLTLEVWTKETGYPYFLVNADLYKCPTCPTQVFLEFAGTATMRHDPDFEKKRAAAPDRIKVW